MTPEELATLKAYLAPWAPTTSENGGPSESVSSKTAAAVSPSGTGATSASVFLASVQPEFNGFPFDGVRELEAAEHHRSRRQQHFLVRARQRHCYQGGAGWQHLAVAGWSGDRKNVPSASRKKGRTERRHSLPLPWNGTIPFPRSRHFGESARKLCDGYSMEKTAC